MGKGGSRLPPPHHHVFYRYLRRHGDFLPVVLFFVFVGWGCFRAWCFRVFQLVCSLFAHDFDPDTLIFLIFFFFYAALAN